MRCYGGDVAILHEPNERDAVATKTFDDGRIVDLVPLMWGAAGLNVTRPEDLGLGVYDDVWYYQNQGFALAALIVWDGTGEPAGWMRHPATGRRRPDGDPDREFVRE